MEKHVNMKSFLRDNKNKHCHPSYVIYALNVLNDSFRILAQYLET